MFGGLYKLPGGQHGLACKTFVQQCYFVRCVVDDIFHHGGRQGRKGAKEEENVLIFSIVDTGLPVGSNVLVI